MQIHARPTTYTFSHIFTHAYIQAYIYTYIHYIHKIYSNPSEGRVYFYLRPTGG
jgi:hypothetical protein